MIEINKIYNEDCMVTANKIGKIVDVIITSPPYNTSRKGSSLNEACANIRYDNFDDCKEDDDYIKWSISVFESLDKCLKENGCILYNLSYSSENTHLIWLTIADIIKSTVFTVADCIVWKKPTTSPNSCSSNKLTRICEYVFVICRKNEIETFNSNKEISSFRKTGQASYKNYTNIIEAKNNDGSIDTHKATFSSELVRKLINLYASKGSLVYDCFMGTGTTAVGCIEERLDFIGSEISTHYCEIANKRIKSLLSQPKLF